MSTGTSTRSRTRQKGAVCFEFERDGEDRRVRVANDIDVSFTDSITVSDPDEREYADALPELPPPGSGTELFDCGEDVSALFCPECGEPSEVGRTCRRSRCPRCWQSWAFHRGKIVVAKVDGLRRYWNASRSVTYYNHHLTVSFRDSTRFDSVDPLDRGFDAVKRLMDEINVSTGHAVYHPWRIREAYRGEVSGHKSGDGDMTWTDVLGKIESEAWSWETVREEFLVYAPHFHVIGISEFAQTAAVTERIEEQTGVVIHRITKGEDSSVSLYDLYDLCSVAAYALSHAGLSDDGGEFRAAYRPFGEVANFSPTPGVEAEVDEVMREVAPDVLGVHFSKPRCEAERVDEDKIREETPAADVKPSVGWATDGGIAVDVAGWGSAGTTDLDAGGVGGGEGMWEATRGVVPDFATQPPESLLARCGARLRPMRAAGEYLGDLDWRSGIDEETLTRLETAFEEWRDQGRPESEEPPPVPPPE